VGHNASKLESMTTDLLAFGKVGKASKGCAEGEMPSRTR
jgi:hypothetical protein